MMAAMRAILFAFFMTLTTGQHFDGYAPQYVDAKRPYVEVGQPIKIVVQGQDLGGEGSHYMKILGPEIRNCSLPVAPLATARGEVVADQFVAVVTVTEAFPIVAAPLMVCFQYSAARWEQVKVHPSAAGPLWVIPSCSAPASIAVDTHGWKGTLTDGSPPSALHRGGNHQCVWQIQGPPQCKVRIDVTRMSLTGCGAGGAVLRLDGDANLDQDVCEGKQSFISKGDTLAVQFHTVPGFNDGTGWEVQWGFQCPPDLQEATKKPGRKLLFSEDKTIYVRATTCDIPHSPTDPEGLRVTVCDVCDQSCSFGEVTHSMQLARGTATEFSGVVHTWMETSDVVAIKLRQATGDQWCGVSVEIRIGDSGDWKSFAVRTWLDQPVEVGYSYRDYPAASWLLVCEKTLEVRMHTCDGFSAATDPNEIMVSVCSGCSDGYCQTDDVFNPIQLPRDSSKTFTAQITTSYVTADIAGIRLKSAGGRAWCGRAVEVRLGPSDKWKRFHVEKWLDQPVSLPYYPPYANVGTSNAMFCVPWFEPEAGCVTNPDGYWDDSRQGCDWYGFDPIDRCHRSASFVTPEGPLSRKRTANEACCACGGGIVPETCEDALPKWICPEDRILALEETARRCQGGDGEGAPPTLEECQALEACDLYPGCDTITACPDDFLATFCQPIPAMIPE